MFNIKVINSKEKVYFATGFVIAQIISEDFISNSTKVSNYGIKLWYQIQHASKDSRLE